MLVPIVAFRLLHSDFRLPVGGLWEISAFFFGLCAYSLQY
jgi:hypothetical protein